MVRRPQGTKKSRENRRGKASFSRSVVPGFFPDTQAYPGWRRTAAVPWACAGVLHCVRVVLLNRHPCSARGKLLCIRYPKRFVRKAKACSAFFQCFTPVFIRINETPCGHSGKQVMFRNNVLHAAIVFQVQRSVLRVQWKTRSASQRCLCATRRFSVIRPPGQGGHRPPPGGLALRRKTEKIPRERACSHPEGFSGFRAAPASYHDTPNSASGTQHRSNRQYGSAAAGPGGSSPWFRGPGAE